MLLIARQALRWSFPLSPPVRPDLRLVCNALGKLKYKWTEIGVQLGVPQYKLEEFRRKDNPLTATINYWLSGNCEGVSISWPSVVNALLSPHVDAAGAAKEVWDTYCPDYQFQNGKGA